MKQKKMTHVKNDKKMMQDLQKIWDEWYDTKPDIDRELLGEMFHMDGGGIFSNEKNKIAIGFLPFPKSMVVYFFTVLDNNRLKYVDERGITISEFTHWELDSIMKSCILRGKIRDSEHVESDASYV